MTLKNAERRSGERLEIEIPIRVLRFDPEQVETGGFSEDTRTLNVSRSGASIVLRNPVKVGNSLRIVNLTTHRELDFRVVGALGTTADGASIWATECLERRDDFWGVVCPGPTADSSDNSALLQCRGCGRKAQRPLTFMEAEVLDSGGMIILNCDPCGKATYWADADANSRAKNSPTVKTVTPAPFGTESESTEETEKNIEKRATKRSQLKLPILVSNKAGQREESKIQDISKKGLSVPLFMKLDLGDTVKIIYPYDPRSGGIEQTAEVRWRSRFYSEDFPRTYGFRFVS
jgi:hypothetical protein